MLKTLTQKIALYCCASTFAIASTPEFYKTATGAIAATGLVLCANPLISGQTTGTLRAHPRILWSGAFPMAGTMIPLTVATSMVNQTCIAFKGEDLTNIESCFASGAGGFCGAYAIHPLDTWSTWRHADPKSSWQAIRRKARQSKTSCHAGRRSLGFRECIYSTGWAALAPIGAHIFAPYLSETNARIIGGMTVGAFMGLLTTPIHNAKVGAQILSFNRQPIPTDRVIYQQLFKQKKLFNGWKFRVPLYMGAIMWMNTIPRFISPDIIPNS